MPLAVVVTRAGANDGCQTHKVLAALVVRPPAPEVPTDSPDDRGRPTARADGADGNAPSRDRASSRGFRWYAPGRGQERPGVGKVRNAVERCHNVFAPFGRVGRRWDRNARNDLGWCQRAAGSQSNTGSEHQQVPISALDRPRQATTLFIRGGASPGMRQSNHERESL